MYQTSILLSLLLRRYFHREGNRLVFFLCPLLFALGFPLPLIILLDTALPSCPCTIPPPGPHAGLVSLSGSPRLRGGVSHADSGMMLWCPRRGAVVGRIELVKGLKTAS